MKLIKQRMTRVVNIVDEPFDYVFVWMLLIKDDVEPDFDSMFNISTTIQNKFEIHTTYDCSYYENWCYIYIDGYDGKELKIKCWIEEYTKVVTDKSVCQIINVLQNIANESETIHDFYKKLLESL